MKKPSLSKEDLRSLQKRYLVWFYKVTKEALDKIERKFTQLEIDRFILQELKKSDREALLTGQINDFSEYIRNKERSGAELKYSQGKPKPEYLFLIFKLKAIEKTIQRRLGKNGLNAVRRSYEKEMLKRIMEERQDKV